MVHLDTFPDTNIAPENGWLKDYFHLGILNILKKCHSTGTISILFGFTIPNKNNYETTKMGFTGVISLLQVDL